MFDGRLNEAKRRIAELEAALAIATEQHAAIQLMHRERAALVSIIRNGRYITVTFVRNGELTTIEFYATMDVDVNALRKTLLEPLPGSPKGDS